MTIGKDFIQLHVLVFLMSFIPAVSIWISIPSVEIVFLRTLIAVSILGGMILFYKHSIQLPFQQVAKLLLSGVLTSIYWVLLVVSAKVSTASVTLVGLATSTLWVSFISPVFTGKKLSFYQVVTGLHALFGVYMIFSSDFQYSSGMAVAILAAFFGALVTVINGQLARKHNHIVVTFYQMGGAWIGTALFLPIYGKYITQNGIQLNPTTTDIILIVGLAFVFSVYAYSVLIKIMKNLSPFTVAIATNLSPVYGIVMAIIIFGKSELMDIYFYSGATIILASVLAFPVAQAVFQEKKPSVTRIITKTGG